MITRVFVYGTLMRGERNHHWMRGARLLGECVSSPRFSLWSLGAYPVLCPQGHCRVHGEVYQISYAHLRRLDVLEEYPRFYLRRLQPTRFGPAWLYYQQAVPSLARALPGGSWRRRRHRPLTRSAFAGVEAVQGRQRDLT